jgi:hypothetical protein
MVGQIDRSYGSSAHWSWDLHLKSCISQNEKDAPMSTKMINVAMLLLIAGVAAGQVKLKLPDTTAAPGASLVLPISVEDFRHVGSFSLTIAFDKDVLSFTGITNSPKVGIFNATPAANANSNGAVAMSWFNVSPALNIPKGKLLDLNFTYKKGTSALTFVKMIPSSVTDSLANSLPTTIKNGKVSIQTPHRNAKKTKIPAGVK